MSTSRIALSRISLESSKLIVGGAIENNEEKKSSQASIQGAGNQDFARVVINVPAGGNIIVSPWVAGSPANNVVTGAGVNVTVSSANW